MQDNLKINHNNNDHIDFWFSAFLRLIMIKVSKWSTFCLLNLSLWLYMRISGLPVLAYSYSFLLLLVTLGSLRLSVPFIMIKMYQNSSTSGSYLIKWPSMILKLPLGHTWDQTVNVSSSSKYIRYGKGFNYIGNQQRPNQTTDFQWWNHLFSTNETPVCPS